MTSQSDGPKGCRHGWQATKLEREDKFLAIGAQPAKSRHAVTAKPAAAQWQPTSPAGLASSAEKASPSGATD